MMRPLRNGLAARLLLLALLPSLLYLGHWELSFDIPHTNLYWEMPLIGQSRLHDDGEAHENHCHGDGECASASSIAGVAIALLSRVLGLIGANGLLSLVAVLSVMPVQRPGDAPVPPPPRGAARLAGAFGR